MIDIRESFNFRLEGLTLVNSPQYYVYLYDLKDVVVRYLTIFTDSQHPITKAEIFPLNTDGIDILATNVQVHDVSITNYDDAIAVKPCKPQWTYCQCSSNIFVRRVYVYHGVGVSIGSVPPSDDNCVRDVTFMDFRLDRPMKAIYIKTNPGTSGIGEISNIMYRDFYITNALWWVVYIGPQQQLQPQDTGTTGCMYYPVNTYCPTQWRVNIFDITLFNITAIDTIAYYNSPGIIRCDPSSPCTNIRFVDVNVYPQGITSMSDYKGVEQLLMSMFGSSTTDYYWRYIVDNASGASVRSSPQFIKTSPIP
eukprot:CAMPEP_0182436790 /NCGR_PEP_ID=MMETSP1167-20130531/83601_1 /TAXON_ID=2988 /ORGANISM="Mallomonas Sp, Strain CCMP3275" /LENGTH=307 /DNA_ID=CAMNT_0024629333 /DNA_START=689 /DNA_END=1608 /DNA_ORIENTATION=+